MANRRSHEILDELLTISRTQPKSVDTEIVERCIIIADEVLENLDRITQSLGCIAHVMLTQHNERTKKGE